MRHYKLLLIVLLTTCQVYGQNNLLLNLNSYSADDYNISVDKLKDAAGTGCIVINILARGSTKVAGVAMRPLYVFKIFAEKYATVNADNTLRQRSVSFDSIQPKIDNLLHENMYVNVASMAMKSNSAYQQLYSSIRVKKGDKVYFFDGWTTVQYFAVVAYEQSAPLQSAVTVINTDAPVVKVKNMQWPGSDSTPCCPDFEYPENSNPENKMYCIGRQGVVGDYCRLTPVSAHGGFNIPERFTFGPYKGIIAFISARPLTPNKYSNHAFGFVYKGFSSVQSLQLGAKEMRR